MSKNTVTVNLFNHYNIAVFVVFLLISLIALATAIYRYQDELQLRLADESNDLAERAKILNHSLEKSEQTLQGLKQFAQYYLANPKGLYLSNPSIEQEQNQFHLKTNHRDLVRQPKRLRSNITGQGDIADFTEPMRQELAMANALTPAFITASKTNQDATWFYYLSLNRFISIYPWIGRNAWRYSDQMLNEPYLWQIRQGNLTGKQYVWSPPFKDTAGKGIKASIGTGVFLNRIFKGVLVIDVDLASLQQRLPTVALDGQGYVLMNNQGLVLLHIDNSEQGVSTNASWQDIAPKPIKSLTESQLLAINNYQKFSGFLLQKHVLSVNGWNLIKYQKYQDFTAPLLAQYSYLFLGFFIGIGLFLTLVFYLTRKTFIKPATEFISHIEHCAQGDPGKVKPTREWLPWFQIVENIFSENRSLLQQLTEQNLVLDTRVAEKTQALIERSEQHQRDYLLLRSVINAIPEYILFNDNQGRLTGCNSAFEQYIKTTETKLLGEDVYQRLPKPIQQAYDEFQSLPVEQSKAGYQKTIETSGSTFEFFCTRFNNQAGESIGTISILRDISVQFAVQSALQTAKEQAEHANKAKSQFLANMSHEIRTPINAIQGMMALMEKTRLTVFQQQYLVNAQSASGALLHLIDELLDLSRIEAGKLIINKAPASIDQIVDKVLQLNSLNIYKKGLSLQVEIAANVPEFVLTDELRLVQVLANLINNSVKFTHQGGISLFIDATARDDRNVLVRFKVKDTGIGIAKDNQAKLFDAFSQADESMTREYGGSGLGLSISQQIVHLLGGEISLESELEQGTEFTFVLPFTLSEQSDVNQETALSLVSVAYPFSNSLIDAIKGRQWQHHFVQNIEQIQEIEFDLPTVLLIDGDYLSQHKEVDLAAVCQKFPSIKFIGLCQSMMADIAPHIVHQLAKISQPYQLLETPLYRHTLVKISQYIAQLAVNSAENVEQNNAAVITTSSSEPVIADLPNNEHNINNAEQTKLSGVKVLLVEDNLVNQMVAQELLFSMYAEVVIAENGQIALEHLTSNINKENPIDVVLMDIQMPVMDGLTACKKIKEIDELTAIPIIAMTAHARDEDKQASLAAGMDLHIAKPVSANILLSSILTVLK